MSPLRFISALLLGAAFVVLPGCASRKPSATVGDASAKAQVQVEPTGVTFEDRVEANARFAAAVAYELREERDQALVEYYKAALADWANEVLVSDVGRRLLAAKQHEKAVEVLAKCASRKETTPPLHTLLGYAYRETGQSAKAIAENRQALRKAPGFLPAYQNLVQLHLAEKHPAEARKVLDEAVKAVKDDQPETLLGLVETHNFYTRTNPTNELADIKARVAEMLAKVAATEPKSLPFLARMAEAYFFAGDYAKASAIYLDLLAQRPTLPGLRERLIDAFIRNKDWKLASEQIEEIVKKKPDNVGAYIVLSGIAYEEKQPERAAEYLEKAIFYQPELEQAYYDLAGLKINLDKAKEALELLAKAREKFKSKFALEFFTGLAHSQLKQYGEALKYYTTAEEVARKGEPERLSHQFYFQLGATHERNKDHEQAEKYFRKCLDLSPDNADALNYLGYMWAERGVKLTEARRMIEKAVKLEPDNDAFLDSMAWVLYKLKDYKAALDWQLKALKHNDKPDATLYDHLGDIHAALHQTDAARAAWKKSIELEPSDEVRKKLDGQTK